MQTLKSEAVEISSVFPERNWQGVCVQSRRHQRKVAVSQDQWIVLQKKLARSQGLYCFTEKIRKAIPSRGLFKLSDWTPFLREPK